ncbi:MAG: alginate export family protein [Verrucomicrobia bacterium]|nr:alginate export family protein [Verrucomicrobiota bacterium]
MNKSKIPLLTATILTGCVLSTNAQNTTPAAPPTSNTPSAGLVNDWLREQSPEFQKWDLGGQSRARFEHKEYFAVPTVAGAADFRATTPFDENSYLLLRQKIHLGYKPVDWFSIFGEGRDSRSISDRRTPNPEEDPFDLHQAYISLGNLNACPITAKIGRQELSYGDERLVGAFDWNNIGRVFDAAKIRGEGELGWVDAFVGRVVIPDRDNFNVANDYDFFSGVYASSKKILPWQETQLYFLARNVSDQSPAAIGTGLAPWMTGASPRDIYTLGMRLKSLPGQLNGWDYSAEIAGQLGNFSTSAAAPRLEHQAYAAHVGTGYTLSDTFGKPRLGLEYNFASGDSDPTDDKHQTFENLFPTNHKFYGYMDFVSWQNIHNVRLTSSIKPLSKLTLQADYHAFWLAEKNDFFYQANGAPRAAGGYGINAGAGSYIGSEVNVVATCAIRPYANAQVGYGHFFVGDYVKDSLAPVGGAKDADFVYAQLVFNF